MNLAKRNRSFSETNAVKLLAGLLKSKGPCVVELVFLIKVDLSAPMLNSKRPIFSTRHSVSVSQISCIINAPALFWCVRASVCIRGCIFLHACVCVVVGGHEETQRFNNVLNDSTCQS